MAPSNTELMWEHLEAGDIKLARGPLLDIPASSLAPRSFDKVRGMLLGLAIGDALGAPSEGTLPKVRRARFGEIRSYLPNPHAKNKRVGTPTDDSQLAFYTLEVLLGGVPLDPPTLAQQFLEGPIFGIGASVAAALKNLEKGEEWYRAGVPSAGNGALMRIAPVLLPHMELGGTGLWADTVLAASLTHNDPASTAACLAFVAMLWDLLAMDRPPEPDWWLQRYFEVADQFEDSYAYQERMPWAPEHRGRICDYTVEQVNIAKRLGLSALEACERWGSGAYLLETMPSLLIILTNHAADPEAAILRAVNDTLDNDTHAAIIGAAVGALHGAEALPVAWREGLSGQLRGGDDGCIQQLIEQTRDHFWSENGNFA